MIVLSPSICLFLLYANGCRLFLSPRSLDIKRDISGRTNIPGLTRCPVSSINDVTALMAKAARNRSTASTNMNERSSRSHSVFTLYLSATNPHSKQSLAGSLNLCDCTSSTRTHSQASVGCANHALRSVTVTHLLPLRL